MARISSTFARLGLFTTAAMVLALIAAVAQDVPPQPDPARRDEVQPASPQPGAPANGAPDTVAARQPPAAETATAAAQEVVVTGSRIRGSAPVGSPLINVSRQDLAEAGVVSTNQLVQDLPQVTNQGISEGSRTTSGGAGNINYASGFNIHGVGPYATLTLLNGRRIVQSGSSGGLPDPNDIPTIAIQRVDVVADGASAIYGSDAVAGVVNLITRRRFSGLDSSVHYGYGSDYHEYNLGAIAGHDWSTGNITVAVEHSGHSSLSGRDRGFYGADLTGKGGGDYRSNQCAPGNVVIGGTSYALPALAAGTTNLCDPLKSQDLLPSQRRNSVTASLSQDIGTKLTLFADALYSHRSFSFQPGDTTASLTVPSTNPYFVLPAGVAAASEVANVSFGGQIPNNTSTGYSKVFQVTAGATWKPFGDWQVDGNYTYGRSKDLSESTLGVNNGALAVALASTNPATALNPYGVNSPAVLGGVFNQLFRAPGLNKEQQGELTATGSLFRLPGGAVRLAVGGEIIRDTIATGVDQGSPGAIFSLRTNAARTIKSGYGELLIPIFGADNALPGLRKLEVSLAGRISHYSDVGTARNPKVGVNWAPVNGLTLHGSYGTSFRAPVLTQIHGAFNALFVQNYSTPNGTVQGVTLSGFADGNPLTPEHARTFSLGADLAPPTIPRLRASVNWFDIRYTGQVNAVLSDLTILQSPSIQAQYADRIVQGAAATTLIQQFVAAGYPVIGALPANANLFIYGNNVNSGVTRTQGIDFQVGYSLGQVSAGVNGTRFTKYDAAVSAAAPLLNELNAIFYPPKFRTRSTLRWTDGTYDATLFWNYTNPYRNNRVDPEQHVRAYNTFDLHLAYTWNDLDIPLAKAITFAIDATNLLNKRPPFVNIAESPNGGGGYDPTVTNPIGRIVAFTASSKF